MTSPSPPINQTVRLFIGLMPSRQTQAQIKRWADTWQWPAGAQRAKAERLHLTLHFLGDVPAVKLPALKDGLQVPFEPFELGLGMPEVWNQGVAVVRPVMIPAGLQDLHARLNAALLGLGVPSVRGTFTPHITLARHATGAMPPAKPLSIRRRVDHYVLVRSELSSPARYFVEQTYHVLTAAPVSAQLA
jgi:RNA 2',3'-cyclic 3'-phosphodiesterase